MFSSSVGGVLCVLLLSLCFLSVIGLYFLKKRAEFSKFSTFWCFVPEANPSGRPVSVRTDVLSTSSVACSTGRPIFPTGRSHPKSFQYPFRPDAPFSVRTDVSDGFFVANPIKKKKKNFEKSKKSHCFVCVLGTFHYYDEIEFIYGIKKSLNIILGLNVILWLMIFYDCYGQFNLHVSLVFGTDKAC